ncbi:type I-B CRISPR-associated protein Cas8b/Csh1 [Alkaliphilus serpentinus]|uniref:Type I-B CRISPR-associated protein Cas8b/Csh1 n=1 Tax=Alkaliphilus serpentinus TaxID=1482731 RepID=A0A833HNN5_9FIRM|nr:type I-B CRISPR-associated protein Cas8b/Csh1 [Alkaliphilus serpentinus]KAB3529800.1 type I-B CRISPR-associated protein Cas8b/Csh1 [Alkaliphilus serpentinus]
MLFDAVKIFEKVYKEHGDDLITDSYIPADGEYIIVDPYQDDFTITNRIHIKLNKKTRTIDFTIDDIEFIQKADYLSRYLDSNKALSDKNIHSNNYLTFFVKKENLHNGKMTNEIIEKYYATLKNPFIKYSKPKSKKLYLSIQEKIGQPDIEQIEKIEAWIKNNIFNLTDKDTKDKTYLKIFFKYDLLTYQRESERYILANIYNSTDYNEVIGERTYGLPNDNMGLNAKKPYLENKTRKITVPYLLSVEEVLMQKKFFDFLANLVAVSKTNIYVDEKGIKAYTNDEIPIEDFCGYYLRVKKGKEIEIHDFDTIGLYKAIIKPLDLENVLCLEKSNLQYNRIHKLSTLKNIINEIFFSKFLTTNYFTDAKDIRINDNILKRNLLLSRTALFTWFYKGSNQNAWKILNNSSLELIKGSIKNGYLLKASDQFNLRCALKKYFEGGDNMGDILIDVKNKLRRKINQNSTATIENDNEYNFAVGQLTSYFISLSRSKNKVHSLANPIINAKSDERIKEELKKLYKKYNYSINTSSTRFKNLFAMVSSYEPEDKNNEDLIIAGYLHSNLIYEKSDKGEGENE